jgi:phosphoesterase RecJ-like protein
MMIIPKAKKNVIKLVLDEIDKANNIIISTHINPDGDAIGSSLAIQNYAKSRGKNVQIIITDPVPEYLRFLTGSDEIITYEIEKHSTIIMNADLIIVADLNNIGRMNNEGQAISKSSAKKIVIDHHVDHQEFADLYIIDSTASSTGELVWYLLKSDTGFKIDIPTAEALYTAIMSDTGNFRFSSTTPEVHRIAAELIESGIQPEKIYDEVYNIMPFNKMKLFGETYSGLELFYENQLCVATITETLFEKTGTNESDTENLVESLLSIQGVKAGILFTDVPSKNVVRISLRSKIGIDVRQIAVLFDGGGHNQAAGARVYNSDLMTVKKQVIEKSEILFK